MASLLRSISTLRRLTTSSCCLHEACDEARQTRQGRRKLERPCAKLVARRPKSSSSRRELGTIRRRLGRRPASLGRGVARLPCARSSSVKAPQAPRGPADVWSEPRQAWTEHAKLALESGELGGNRRKLAATQDSGVRFAASLTRGVKISFPDGSRLLDPTAGCFGLVVRSSLPHARCFRLQAGDEATELPVEEGALPEIEQFFENVKVGRRILPNIETPAQSVRVKYVRA